MEVTSVISFSTSKGALLENVLGFVRVMDTVMEHIEQRMPQILG